MRAQLTIQPGALLSKCDNWAKQTRGNIYQQSHHFIILLKTNKEVLAAPNCLDFFYSLTSDNKGDNVLSCSCYLNSVDAGAFEGGLEEEGVLSSSDSYFYILLNRCCPSHSGSKSI